MKKIMKVVYSQEKSEFRNHEESAPYMGEESWEVGEKFNGEFVRGVVAEIIQDGCSAIDIWVKAPTGALVMAMTISPYAVQRIYYGEG